MIYIINKGVHTLLKTHDYTRARIFYRSRVNCRRGYDTRPIKLLVKFELSNKIYKIKED